jgi:hypothetical protein
MFPEKDDQFDKTGLIIYEGSVPRNNTFSIKTIIPGRIIALEVLK